MLLVAAAFCQGQMLRNKGSKILLYPQLSRIQARGTLRILEFRRPRRPVCSVGTLQDGPFRWGLNLKAGLSQR